MGTPEFAVPTLRQVANKGHVVAAVYTRAPKTGVRRGLGIKKTPVHEAAEELGIPVFTPTTLKDHETQTVFRKHGADVGLVIAYGLLLPLPILEAPKLGCLNLHASLLPRWRGAAPIQRAIMAGDAETGVDLMRMEESLDTGSVALQEVIPIRPEDTAGDLTRRLAHLGAALATRGLFALEKGNLHFVEQASVGVCYAHKIDKSEGEIDWTRSAARIRNQIHALSPVPGAYSSLAFGSRAERVKILRVEDIAMAGVPGTVLDNEMTVACGDRAVRIVEGQRAGHSVLSGRELMRRDSVSVGATFMPPEKSSFAPEAPI